MNDLQSDLKEKGLIEEYPVLPENYSKTKLRNLLSKYEYDIDHHIDALKIGFI